MEAAREGSVRLSPADGTLMPASSAPEEDVLPDPGSGSTPDDASTTDDARTDDVEALIGRVAELEAMLAAKSGASESSPQPVEQSQRKPKGGPIDDEMRRKLVAKRERLELARMAEQAAWEDLKADVRRAAEAGVSYREIGDTIGVTRARVYQIVSGKR